MAPRNPGLVQSDAPALLADLISELTLIGPGVGLLGFSDQITPTFIIGARGVSFQAQDPIYAPAQVFASNGTGVVAVTDIEDTGELEAGVFDVICNMIGANATLSINFMTLAMRNAADTADIAEWTVPLIAAGGATNGGGTPIKFSMSVLQDQRFVIRPLLTDATLIFGVWMMVRRRPDVT